MSIESEDVGWGESWLPVGAETAAVAAAAVAARPPLPLSLTKERVIL